MLEHFANRLDRGVAALLALLLVAMILSVTWQIFTRFVLNDPSGWTEELARFLLIWIGLFGGALAYRRRQHLGLELLAERLRRTDPGIQRWHRRFIDSTVLLFATMVLLGGGTALVLLTQQLAQFSPALGLPMSAVYLALPASGLTMATFALAALLAPMSKRDLGGGRS